MNVRLTASRTAAMAAVTAMLALTACTLPGGAANREGERNELPTPVESENVGEAIEGGATESFEETWSNYLRDSIAEQVSDRQQKLEFLQRYEKPSITEQNMGGLVTDIDLVEDRTAFNVSNGGTSASAIADFDVRLTYANGDSETRKCNPQVGLEQNPEDGLWYVLNPAQLQVFAVCVP